MAVDRYVMKFSNSAISAANYQLMGFNFSSANVFSPAQRIARCIKYVTELQACAAGTNIVEVAERPNGAPGFTPMAWPDAEYTTYTADAVTDGFINTANPHAFPAPIGAGALCPLGTSISVTEKTTHPGPTGRGRHFLPFIQVGQVNAGGEVQGALRTLITNAFNEFFLGVKPAGGAATGSLAGVSAPVVTNVGGSPFYLISTITPQPIFSNLESRRR